MAPSKLRQYDNRYHKWKINYEQDKGISKLYNRALVLRIYTDFSQIKNPRGPNGKMGEVYEKAIHGRENLSNRAMQEKLLSFTVIRENSVFLNEKNHSEGKTKKEKEY